MKHLKLKILLLFLLVILTTIKGARINRLLKIKPQIISEYYRKDIHTNQVYLKMEFATNKCVNKPILNEIRGATITKIELIYTSFRISSNFNQPQLNKKRYEALFQLIPNLKANNLVKWDVFVQTGAKDEEEAKKMMHGFIITYKPKPTKELAIYELKTMKDVLSALEIVPDPEKTETKSDKKIKRKRHFTGKYLPRSRNKKRKGILYTKSGIWNRRRQYITYYDTTNRIKTIIHYKPEKSKSYYSFAIPDSTIFTVLDRNKNWHDISFICDVTGSMSPYSTQIMLWHKLNFNTNKAKYFTFFNDGDHKRDRQKKIGSTGGIYNVIAENYDNVEKEMTKAMLNGYGGDSPENDIEALLKAIENYPDAKDIVLIADNWSNVKDIELLKKVNKPIHVILCGFNGGINLDYLNIAFKTGGTVHTIEQDITNLMDLQDGESIIIYGTKYIIKNGSFSETYEM